ncbi:MAG: aspartate aminotransferase family protein [Alphaproteobacteria bacterium]|nr:aspartate aminotransferase family protein [Alphaproteobacteria bacterium]
MSHILQRILDRELPTVVGGEGNILIDSDGRHYLDACGGAAVSCLGHDNARVRAAICDQVNTIAFGHSGFFTNRPAEDLADSLISGAPKGTGDGRVMFVGSGSEAMEAALKLARQIHVERGEPTRTRFIARGSSYHGNTLGALATGGHAQRRAPFDPLLMTVDHIDPCYEYRYRREGEAEEAFGLRMADQLEDRILHLGAENVAAFVAEPVVGATLGTQPATPGYFKRIRQICDRHGVLFIADEVMCGIGRTGSFFALEQEGVHADITTIAKGLGAGYQPIAAVVASERAIRAIEEGSGRLWNGHTYMSHAVAAAGALAVLNVIRDDNLLDNVRKMGGLLEQRLRTAFGQHPHIGDIRGRGLFWSVELVRERERKTPFAADEALAWHIQDAALEEGLMCYPAQGCADGINGDHVLLAPSYTSTPLEIETIVDTLALAIDRSLKSENIAHA